MKILYLLSVNWNWIFQRPQILELFLEKDYDCTVLNKKVILKCDTSKRNPKPESIVDVYQLPKENLSRTLKKINEWIYKSSLKKCNAYDFVWFTHPMFFKLLPSDYKGKVIYDCMDYHVAMTCDDQKKELYEREQALINRADLIFVSSQRLKDIVPNMKNSILVRNGYVSGHEHIIKEPIKKKSYKIGYIGTVSTWFDFDLLIKSTMTDATIEYHLIGPVLFGRENIKQGNRIFEDGVIAHENLFDHIEFFDALIMPFIVNDLILAVDPVKLYEYISYGKCIISIWYPEIERFSPFVYFYENYDDFMMLIESLKKNGFKPKYREEEREQFLINNTWEKRYELIKRGMGELI